MQSGGPSLYSYEIEHETIENVKLISLCAYMYILKFYINYCQQISMAFFSGRDIHVDSSVHLEEFCQVHFHRQLFFLIFLIFLILFFNFLKKLKN